MKKCSGECGLEKSLDCFSAKRGQCKECFLEYMKKYRKENKEKISKQQKIYNKEHKEKIIEQHKEYKNLHKEDLEENTKRWKENNKERVADYNKKWKENNVGYHKEYKENHKKEISERDNKQRKNRMKTDISYKLRKYMSRDIWVMLKSQNSSKAGHSILEFLPYSPEILMKHLENQFDPWMTWQNHGFYKVSEWDDANPNTWKWQLDHIIPQSDLPYTSMEDDNFKKCWSLSNLRPLSAKQNMLDGATRIRHRKTK